jgi:hypothetical protein
MSISKSGDLKAQIHLHIQGYNLYEGLQVRHNHFQDENPNVR